MKEIILEEGEEYIIKFPDGSEKYYDFKLKEVKNE